jgi:hypothetical protein
LRNCLWRRRIPIQRHGGRENDFRDAQRLARRLLADELILSFVPDAEPRMWRTLTQSKHQLIRDRIRLQNQLEALLEEAWINPGSGSVVQQLQTFAIQLQHFQVNRLGGALECIGQFPPYCISAGRRPVLPVWLGLFLLAIMHWWPRS